MALEGILRRDRTWTAAGLLAVAGLAWLYLLRAPMDAHAPMAMAAGTLESRASDIGGSMVSSMDPEASEIPD